MPLMGQGLLTGAVQLLRAELVTVLWEQASHIPPFFVAFCVTPLASNASELVSSLVFASRKRMKNISLTYCQVRC